MNQPADGPSPMARATRAVAAAAVAAAIEVAVLSLIVWLRGGSVRGALTNPVFIVVLGITATITGVVALDRKETNAAQPVSAAVQVATAVGVASSVCAAIGVVIASIADKRIVEVLTDRRFLIPAGIAILVAGLQAWPDKPT